MISNILIHKIKVTRETKSGLNKIGEEITTISTIYNSVNVRVEESSPDLQYLKEGTFPTKSIIIYTEPATILKPKDTVIAVVVPNYQVNEVIGRVLNFVTGLNNHHNEAVIEIL